MCLLSPACRRRRRHAGAALGWMSGAIVSDYDLNSKIRAQNRTRNRCGYNRYMGGPLHGQDPSCHLHGFQRGVIRRGCFRCRSSGIAQGGDLAAGRHERRNEAGCVARPPGAQTRQNKAGGMAALLCHLAFSTIRVATVK